ncbi:MULTISPECIES: hypothetical protein [Cyanophyceae]|uniref:hypothetical protein n=1 Tax=Cyanophyceae TaxID=3028117 RepID=UPI0016849EDB|nr:MULTISPECIES: hypothetical protein [Cyanophyceae]MBD1917261.1 hypothetical protein [Phormidium sp. FACHB-77]MBD2028477.1 hypothetical protein [Phormidium sp. FACHB-322]MBD2049658.1 hypothetical protein [Leptolyngbya sp. FACHB-60]
MTYSSDRLDRIETLLATVAESQARTQIIVEQNAAGLRETRAIADSNARAIEAWSSRIEEGIAEAEEVSSSMATNTNRRMEDAIADTVQMIADMGRQQQETDQRFEVFLSEARADRAEMRAAREANATEHRAFTQNIQVLLAEISRLWQRVAG